METRKGRYLARHGQKHIETRLSMIIAKDLVQCCKCKEWKYADEFKPHKGNKNGCDSRCRTCTNNYNSPERRRGEKSKFGSGRREANRRGLAWELSIDDWKKLTTPNSCCYCGQSLPPTGCGIDRKNNDIGYTKDNCVPCCTRCNRSKNKFFTHDEFLKIGVVIKEIDSARRQKEK